MKANNLLEKNVEWAALGLAGLWVLWVVWSYGINRPVAIDLGKGESCSPGEVDVKVREGPASKLEKMLANNDPLNARKPDIIGDFEKRMRPTYAGDYGPLAVYSPPPYDLSADAGPSAPPVAGGSSNSASQFIGIDAKISGLPTTMPAPRITEVLSQRDQVLPQAAAALVPMSPAMLAPSSGGVGASNIPPAAGLGSGMSVRPGTLEWAGPGGNQPPPPPRAAAPAPARPRPAVAAAGDVEPMDLAYVQVKAKYPEGAFDAACRAAHFPNLLLTQKVYLEVQLVRQEQLPDGTWGNETAVPPLKFNVPPVQRASDPQRYVTWAQQPASQVTILTPPFYQLLVGRPVAPGRGDNVPAAGGFDARAIAQQIKTEKMSFTKRTQFFQKNGYTAEQKAAILDALKKLDQEEKAAKQPLKRGGKRGAGPGENDAQDPQALRMMLAQANPRPAERGGPSIFDSAFGGAPAGSPPPPPGAGPMLNPNDPGGIARPGQNLDFDIWAWDETVQPGKTYRYKVRVLAKNPLYGVRNLPVDEKLTRILELPNDANSAWSEWSDAVEVKPQVQFYLAAGLFGQNVRFNVYRWQNGRTNKSAQPFVVGVGDAIGGIERDSQVDFSTGFTVVDIRPVGGDDCRVTAIDANGNQQVHYWKRDRSDKSKDALDAEAQSAAPAGAAGGAASLGLGAYNTPANTGRAAGGAMSNMPNMPNMPGMTPPPPGSRAARSTMGRGPARGD